MAIQDTLGKSITDITNKVDAFNDIAFDKSMDSFKNCLGTGFPFDVLQAAQNYAKNLSTVLNSSLDELICGVSLLDKVEATIPTPATNPDLGKLYDKYVSEPLFSSEEEKQKYLNNGLASGHTVTNSSWVGKKFIFDKNTDYEKIFADDANSVTITRNYATNDSVSVVVAVDQLLRGPNNGLTAKTDAQNLLPPVSGIFPVFGKYNNGSVKTGTANFSGSNKITIDYIAEFKKGTFATEPDIVEFTITSLNYNGDWCDINDGLTSAQKADMNKAAFNALKDQKEQAMNTLKSEFMNSSMLNDTLNDTVNKLKDSNPALELLDTVAIANSVKSSLANTAIGTLGGNGITFDTTFVNTLANEIANSSINTFLEKNGIPGDIGKGCTAKYLEGISATLGKVGIGTKIDIGQYDFGPETVSLDYAQLMSNNILGQMNAAFSTGILSTECLQAINNQFDLISNDLITAQDAFRKMVSIPVPGKI